MEIGTRVVVCLAGLWALYALFVILIASDNEED